MGERDRRPGQLQDAIRRQIDFTIPEGKQYKLKESTATLVVRPRGWHLVEKHVAGRRRAGLGEPVRFRPVLLPQRAGAARARQRVRTSICRRWRAISKRGCGTTSSISRRTRSAIPRGTIRATVLIETILAAFEMDEILYELRDHAAGLNAAGGITSSA